MYRMLLITRCPSFCVFSLHGITAIIIIATIFNIEGNKYNLISILKHHVNSISSSISYGHAIDSVL